METDKAGNKDRIALEQSLSCADIVRRAGLLSIEELGCIQNELGRKKGNQLSRINFQRTYPLGGAYESIQKRATQAPVKCQECKELIKFNDSDRSVTFTSERLIPTITAEPPRVMLLFSNPHPHSVHQGMFLSPNTKGRENLFWPVMADAGWLPIAEEDRNPKQLRDICLQVKYPGPFELIFYCYYAFPTKDTDDISEIIGKNYFNQFIEPESRDEFRKTILETSVEAVVTFKKEIFNLVSENPVDIYIDRLINRELIQSRISDIDKWIPVFLTFPTGWRYHKQFRQLRKASLDTTREVICSGLNVPEGRTT